MGSICSCLCLENLEEYIRSDASMHGHCGCLRCLAQQLLHMYTAFLQRQEVSAVPLDDQGMDSFHSSTSVMDNSTCDTYRSPPRPLPYDDPRSSQVQLGELLSRREKPSSHEENEALTGSNNGTDLEMSTTKFSGSSYEAASKLYRSKSSLKETSPEIPNAMTYFHSYEDAECPTCLEEYTYENPRIVMKCSHHFHLSCIYEWQERSEWCPVCGKVMVFNET
ncbi:uncharacterized protein A4U43_UnF7090 [Asparagus officinalis]|uniref:RING-type E3 ubiquitin transferase n=1 Tax=Asparagus officinalis TaxID=4686 RepID=A0A1R3L6A5_ASPOF|nr:E3 ubiquitin-protein ligase At3g02290-like [Asparagus officinalis]XP_020250375.1 E3 ubiquitin-protein ligase At3g02290-like [Asparagus officinalis]XP_020250376.1 E3 ubiquitin-protein ligase At3g02290-like [Asparagus officinalis]ONK55146.1 uncharacterized protein A4U43_UnF7090 [Asparagus officinalis]